MIIWSHLESPLVQKMSDTAPWKTRGRAFASSPFIRQRRTRQALIAYWNIEPYLRILFVCHTRGVLMNLLMLCSYIPGEPSFVAIYVPF